MNPPAPPHQHVFTYSECWAQMEPSSRVHYFARLRDTGALVVYYRRLGDGDAEPWRSKAIGEEQARSILEIFLNLSIPFKTAARPGNTGHHNSSLEIHRPGLHITLWWDCGDNLVIAAMEPLLHAIRPLVEEIHDELGSLPKQRRGVVGGPL